MASDEVAIVRSRPGWLTAICAASLVWAAFGAMGLMMGVVGLVAGPQMQNPFQNAMGPSPPEEILEMQAEMQREIQAVSEPWMPISIGLLVVQGLLIVGLAVGAIAALCRKPFGRRLLIGALVFGLSVEAVQLYPAISIQLEMADVMERMMPKIMNASMPASAKMPPGAPQFGSMMKAGMRMAMMFGIMFAVVIALAKAVFAVCAVVYLKRPEMVALYAGLPADADDFSVGELDENDFDLA